ncbi:PTPRU phosphatase, partial [Campylorhamphus procurvoides]|nr:PTPRU phosphatase [Campylorhamphus procurvoides]
MALKLLALRFLLALISLQSAQGQEKLDPKVQGVSQDTEKCQRPHWDSRFQLAPDQENYRKNEEVMLSCPEGFQPSFTRVKCSSEIQSFAQGKPVHREVWLGRDTRGAWIRIRSTVECIEVLQVVPGTFEISSTSIKLNWTCRFPDACRGMRAMCRPAVPSSPPCEAKEVKGEEMLQGQEGTFTCSQLQPFTDYSVTIFLSPSTILFSWWFRTEETVPDKPEKLWLDRISGSLRWKALPSCKGEIIGYQLNITARSAGDGGFLEMERLQVNGSVTEHRLLEHSPGSSYVVSIRGRTAAGAGAASLWEFQPKSSDNQQPLSISCRRVQDISPSQGTAILSLRPITSEGVREHQLVVAMTHNGSVIESTCFGQPQPFSASQQPFNSSQQPFNTSQQLYNASQQPNIYVAAVLNLTAPMDFILGDGTQGQGYHNAALHPGWNYTALLRLVRRSPQSEKFTCVCYSFSVVTGHASGTWHGTVIGLVVLLALLLITAVILWLVLSRRRKYLPNKAKEDN